MLASLARLSKEARKLETLDTLGVSITAPPYLLLTSAGLPSFISSEACGTEGRLEVLG
jgi:hypothetical protein